MRQIDYYRTLWRHRARKPPGNARDWPYYRAIEFGMLGISRGYGARFPKTDAYTMLEFGVATGNSFERMLHFRDVLQRRLRIPQRVTCIGFDTFEGYRHHGLTTGPRLGGQVISRPTPGRSRAVP